MHLYHLAKFDENYSMCPFNCSHVPQNVENAHVHNYRKLRAEVMIFSEVMFGNYERWLPMHHFYQWWFST